MEQRLFTEVLTRISSQSNGVTRRPASPNTTLEIQM